MPRKEPHRGCPLLVLTTYGPAQWVTAGSIPSDLSSWADIPMGFPYMAACCMATALGLQSTASRGCAPLSDMYAHVLGLGRSIPTATGKPGQSPAEGCSPQTWSGLSFTLGWCFPARRKLISWNKDCSQCSIKELEETAPEELRMELMGFKKWFILPTHSMDSCLMQHCSLTPPGEGGVRAHCGCTSVQ